MYGQEVNKHQLKWSDFIKSDSLKSDINIIGCKTRQLSKFNII